MTTEVFIFPMSFAQQRLWFHSQLDPGSAAYNIPGAVRLRGALDVAALEQSLNEIIRRHESLRTGFDVVEAKPVQVIAAELKISLNVRSLRDVPEGEREEAARREARSEAQLPFDLKRPPLLRASLLKLDEQDHIFLLTMHHIVSDGWSTGVMLGELTALYGAFIEGRPSPLAELPIQYADYAVWQREWLQGGVLEDQLSYWKKRLGGELPVLRLPSDRPRPATPSGKGAYHPVHLPAELTAALKTLSQQRGVTLFMTLLAAFKTLLYRYTRQEDIVVGTPIANRNRSETEGLIGFFANTLAIRTDLSGDPTFHELLERVREVMVGASAHQDLPFEKLVEELRPDRALGSNPLFQVVFLLLGGVQEAASLPGVTFEPWELKWEAVKFDFEFHLSETSSGIVGSVAYNTDLYDEATVARLAANYLTLLEAIVENPRERVSRLRLLAPEERSRLLSRGVRDAADTKARPLSLHGLFAERAALTPDAPALIFEDSSLTYGELSVRVEQAARELRVRGLEAGTTVGLLFGRSFDLVVGLLAALRAGACVMPLEPAAASSRLNRALSRARLRAIITTRELAAELADASLPGSPTLLSIDGTLSADLVRAAEPLADETGPGSSALLLSAGGGREELVVFTHDAVRSRLQTLQESFRLEEGEAVLHKASPAADEWAWELLWPLLFGGRVVLAPPDAGHEETRRLIFERGVGVAHAVASELRAWAGESAPVAEDGGKVARRLRLTILGGEAVPGRTLAGWRRTSGCEVVRLYGVPEAAEVLDAEGACAAAPNVGEAAPPAGGDQSLVTLRPLPGTALLVLDETGQPSPQGVAGEIHVGGRLLDGVRAYTAPEVEGAELAGSQRRPSLTPNTFAEVPGVNLMPTGDHGRWLNDGGLLIEGRTRRRAWVDGRLVSFAEVEAALSAHPAVEDCAVRARHSDTGTQLVAYVVLGAAATDEALSAKLAAELSTEEVPQVFVRVRMLPLDGTGELDEAALSSLTVAGEEERRDWEERLRRAKGVEEVVVLEQEEEDPETLLHTLDLVGEVEASTTPAPAQAQAAANKENGFAARQGQNGNGNGNGSGNGLPKTNGQKNDKRWAIADGGPAVEEEAGGPRNLRQTLERAAAASPQRGVIFDAPDAQRRLSYAELLTLARRQATRLRAAGVSAGDCVILQAEQAEPFLIGFWGCVMIGAVPAPLTPPSSYEAGGAAGRVVSKVWEVLGEPAVLAGDQEAAGVRSLLGERARVIEIVSGEEKVEPVSEGAADWHDAGEDELALLLFTSGSTGQPKGVMLSHRNLLARSRGTARLNGFTSDDVSVNWMPLTHVGGIVYFHLRDVYLGCEQVQARTADVLADPLHWLDLMERHRATVTWAPNFSYGLINAESERMAGRRWDLSRVRFILNGGEAVNAQTGRRFLRLLGEHGLPQTAMHPAYGMSETSSGITYSYDFTPEKTTDEDKHVTVGVPIPGVMLRIVDERGQLVEEGVIGYLQIRGETITSGYYGQPELNAEVFDAEGWFNTGDLAFISDGRLTITGREKDILIVNGANYYSHEIEAIVEELPGVVTSFTAVCPVRRPGDDTDCVAVFYNSEHAETARRHEQINEIRQKLIQKIGINPDYVLPVEKEEIPKTSIGKLQRAQLRQRFEEGRFAALVKQIELERGGANTLPDFFFRQVWRPKRAGRGGFTGRPAAAVVFLDDAGLGEEVCRSLEQSGTLCVRVRAGGMFVRESATLYRLDPARAEHYVSLLDSLTEGRAVPGLFLHLWPYDLPAGSDLKALGAAHERGFYSLFWLAQALARVAAPEDAPGGAAGNGNGNGASRRGTLEPGGCRLVVVTAAAQPSRPGSLRAYHHAGLPGLLKSMRSEMPWLASRHLDFEAAEPGGDAALLLAELSLRKGDEEVSYRGGERLVPRLRRVNLLKEGKRPLPFKRGGLYLLTGGLGGVGSHLARHLVRQYGVRLLLVGRTPEEEVRGGGAAPVSSAGEGPRPDGAERRDRRAQRLRSIENAAPDACLYRGVDVCDLEGLRRAVREAEQHWGEPLGGVFHLAGEMNLLEHWRRLDEHWVAAESAERVAAGLRAKVEGAWTLYELLREREDAFFVGFSSVNGVFGAATFSVYAAANSFLDSFVRHQREQGHPRSWCFNWTMWEETGMSQGAPSAVAAASRSFGYRVLSDEQGTRALLAGLSLPPESLVVGLDAGQGHGRRAVESATPPARKLVAYYTAPAGEVPAADLLALVGEGEAAGRGWEFVRVEAMPRGEDGSVDRQKLASAAQSKGRLRTRREPPRNDLEGQLAAIWKQVLKVKELGIHDNFFEQGGHSLLGVQLVTQVNKAFKVNLTLAQLFEAPTVATQAEMLVRNEAEPGQVLAIARLRKRLESMSPEQIRSALKTRPQTQVQAQ